MTVENAIIALQEIAGAVTGIKGAPNYAPDALNVYPIAVAYPESGNISIQVVGEMQGLHALVLEVHVARKNLASDIQLAISYIESIAAAILDDVTLSGTVDTLGGLEYRFGAMSWGGQDTFGVRFRLTNVKIRSTV